MEPIEQKFAAFMNSLSPEEQRAVVPLMATFAGSMSGPPPGAAGPDEALPPPPPAPDKPQLPGVMAAPPPSAVPGGPPLPPPDPAAMSIGRQMY